LEIRLEGAKQNSWRLSRGGSGTRAGKQFCGWWGWLKKNSVKISTIRAYRIELRKVDMYG